MVISLRWGEEVTNEKRERERERARAKFVRPFDGCTANAQSRASPYCKKHGGRKNKPCFVAGCKTTS